MARIVLEVVADDVRGIALQNDHPKGVESGAAPAVIRP